MIATDSKNQLAELLQERRNSQKIVGFVPTMGALHQGHLALIQEAEKQCDVVVVSIFVNPTQFNNPEDLNKYPRTVERDIDLLKSTITGDLIIFTPTADQIYGDQVKSDVFDFEPLASLMEGKFRPGHFDGVGTVLQKLFTIINPDKAFFGEKDYQQLLIVKKLVSLLQLPVQIIGCPINRQEDGLARSSRNERLSVKDRQTATLIYRTLTEVKAQFGKPDFLEIFLNLKQNITEHSDFEVEYFEITDAETLETVTDFNSHKKYRAFIAAEIGGVRLIDNMALN